MGRALQAEITAISPRVLSRLQNRMLRVQQLTGVHKKRAQEQLYYALKQLGLDQSDLASIYDY